MNSFERNIVLILVVLAAGSVIIWYAILSFSLHINYAEALVAYGTLTLAIATAASTLWSMFERKETLTKDHWEVLKNSVMAPIRTKLHYVYANTFRFSDLSITELSFLHYKVERYTEFSNINRLDEFAEKTIKKDNDFEYTLTSEGSDKVNVKLYDDLKNHFKGLNEELDDNKIFIRENARKTWKEVIELIKRISTDSKFVSLTKKYCVGDNELVNNGTKLMMLKFVFISIFSKKKMAQRYYNDFYPAYKNIAFEPLYSIAMDLKETSVEVKNIKSLEKDAQTLLKSFNRIGELMENRGLAGNCNYVH